MKIFKISFVLAVLLLYSSCSIKQMAYKSVANAMAPLPEQKIKIKPAADVPDPTIVLTGEDDVELVGSVFPVILKLYEAMAVQDPKHRGLAVMTGQLYVTYANVFVETPAIYLSDDEFDKKNEALLRARKFYLRGAGFALSALDTAYHGFKEAVFSDNSERISFYMQKCKNYDADALYWAGAGLLAAFAIDPLASDAVQSAAGAVAMLEKVCLLNPSYDKGAAWEILTKFYAAAPEGLGGGAEKAMAAYKKALLLSNGKKPSIHVTYAQSFCIPAQDGKGFDDALEKALSIDPEADPANRLVITLSQNYAKWLKEHKEDFILGD